MMSSTQQQQRRRTTVRSNASSLIIRIAMLSAVIMTFVPSGVTAQQQQQEEEPLVSVSGEVVIQGIGGTGRPIRVAFHDTDFQGLTMSIETTTTQTFEAAPTAAPTTAEEEQPYITYQKQEGVVDCVNTNTGDDNVVIVAGIIQGTARSQRTPAGSKYFQAGDRFLTALYGNHVGNDAFQKDEIGEISNLGPAQDVTLDGGGIDSSDCLYFTAADFDLRPVASGHLTVQK